jgi:hypothetical protein
VRLARLAATRQASSMPPILPSGTIEIAAAGSTRAGTEEYGLLPRRRLSREGPRPKDRGVLPAADQRQSERPGAAQPCCAIRFQDGVLWERLRNEHPGVCQAPADLQPDVWTKMKIVVSGTQGRALRERSSSAMPDGKRPEDGRLRGRHCTLGARDDGAYFSDLKISRN